MSNLKYTKDQIQDDDEEDMKLVNVNMLNGGPDVA
jgi:hypothetical protein